MDVVSLTLETEEFSGITITRNFNGFVLKRAETTDGTIFEVFIPNTKPDYTVTSTPMTKEEIEESKRSMFPEPKESGRRHYQSVSSKGGGSWKTTAWFEGEKPWWDERNGWEKV